MKTKFHAKLSFVLLKVSFYVDYFCTNYIVKVYLRALLYYTKGDEIYANYLN